MCADIPDQPAPFILYGYTDSHCQQRKEKARGRRLSNHHHRPIKGNSLYKRLSDKLKALNFLVLVHHTSGWIT